MDSLTIDWKDTIKNGTQLPEMISYSIAPGKFVAIFKSPHCLPYKKGDFIQIEMNYKIIFEGIVNFIGDYSFSLINPINEIVL